MSILDELKKLTHPYEDEDEGFEEFDDEPQGRDVFEDRRVKMDDRRSKVVNIHATTQLKVIRKSAHVDLISASLDTENLRAGEDMRLC